MAENRNKKAGAKDLPAQKDPPKGKLVGIEVHLESPHADKEPRMRFPPKKNHGEAIDEYKRRYGILSTEHEFICEPVYEEEPA